MPWYPNDQRYWYLGLGACVGLILVAGVYWACFDPEPLGSRFVMAPDPDYVAEREARGHPSPALKVYLADDAPCSGERYELAIERWHEAGWVLAELTPDRALAGLIVSGDASTLPPETISNPLRMRAATGYLNDELWVVFRHDDIDGSGEADVCDSTDTTIEHEFGHGIYALTHTTRMQTLMTERHADSAMVFPAPPDTPARDTASP